MKADQQLQKLFTSVAFTCLGNPVPGDGDPVDRQVKFSQPNNSFVINKNVIYLVVSEVIPPFNVYSSKIGDLPWSLLAEGHSGSSAAIPADVSLQCSSALRDSSRVARKRRISSTACSRSTCSRRRCAPNRHRCMAARVNALGSGASASATGLARPSDAAAGASAAAAACTGAAGTGTTCAAAGAATGGSATATTAGLGLRMLE